MNIFDETYLKIEGFISIEENQRLKNATGKYSCLFRGSVFKTSKTKDALKHLQNDKIEVLWMGSNPNVPESLERLKNQDMPGYFSEFIEQKNSGHFSEVNVTENGEYVTRWDPINNPVRGWEFYSSIFSNIFDIKKVLMANFIPWGSSKFESFLKEVDGFDEKLLSRIIEFSSELNDSLIENLQPKLIVVPKSIGENNRLSDISLHNSQLNNLKSYKFKKDKNYFYYSIGEHSLYPNVKVLCCNHPSGVRLNSMNRVLAKENLSKNIKEHCGII